MTKRENNIAIGLGVTVLLVVIWSVAVSPYLDAIGDINSNIRKAQDKWADDNHVFAHRKGLEKVWTEITDDGLTDDQSKAEQQALNDASNWAYSAGVNITALKSERVTEAGPFLVISFHVTGNASTPAVKRMLYAFETAKIPVRVNDMQITPQKEGTDALIIQLSLSTLCLKPDQPANKTTLTRANGEDKSWN